LFPLHPHQRFALTPESINRLKSGRKPTTVVAERARFCDLLRMPGTRTLVLVSLMLTAPALAKQPSSPLTLSPSKGSPPEKPMNLEKEQAAALAELAAKDPAQTDRITRAVKQVASLWRRSDGGEGDFISFLREQFIGDAKKL